MLCRLSFGQRDGPQRGTVEKNSSRAMQRIVTRELRLDSRVLSRELYKFPTDLVFFREKRDPKNSFYLLTVHTVYLLIHIGHETGSREL